MYKRILIATDGTELASKAVAHGLALAKIDKAPVTIVTVTDIWSAFDMAHESRTGTRNPIDEFEKQAAAGAKKILDSARELARAQGVEAALIHVPDKHPAEGIVAKAEEIGADLIVMASHGRRSINRLLLGSVANEVVTHSKVPVLVVR
jgi:nucleotide-binding universal stress UspA family protein